MQVPMTVATLPESPLAIFAISICHNPVGSVSYETGPPRYGVWRLLSANDGSDAVANIRRVPAESVGSLLVEERQRKGSCLQPSQLPRHGCGNFLLRCINVPSPRHASCVSLYSIFHSKH